MSQKGFGKGSGLFNGFIPAGMDHTERTRVLFWVFTLFVWFACGTQPSIGKQPNILFLFADDLSYETVGFAGVEPVSTPNLDQLARRGLVFTHAYNMGGWNGAICVASRSMLMTGRTLWRAHALDGSLGKERDEGRVWPEAMRRAGYRTYFSGKWHVNAKAENWFDVIKHLRPGMPPDDETAYNRPAANGQDSWSPTDKSRGGYWGGGKHWTEVTADDAISFLDDSKDHDQPFFMYVAFNAPHDPRQSPSEFLDKYPIDEIRVPESFLEEYPFAKQIGCEPSLRDERLAPFPRTRHAIQTHRREYFAAITHLDSQIGRVLDHLRSSGLDDETIVVFTADQGLSVGHHGLMGKQNAYDVSVRAPFVMAGPGIPNDQKNSQPIYVQDSMATCLALAEGSKPAFVEFQDLRPLIAGSQTIYTDGIYFGYLDLQRSVTFNSMKLIDYPKANVQRLYDLKNDPHEIHDLIDVPEYAKNVKELQKRLETLVAKYEVKK
jgi:arylsulfatase A-like enzyme